MKIKIKTNFSIKKRKLHNKKKTYKKKRNNRKQKIQKGGKLDKSYYYLLAKTHYSFTGLEDFNLYSKDKLIEILTKLNMKHDYVTDFYKKLQINSSTAINAIFVNTFEPHLSESVYEKSYTMFMTYELDIFLQTFINYQITSKDIETEVTKLITYTYNFVNDISNTNEIKYAEFKKFVTTMFNARYFSINSINFVRYFMIYDMIDDYKTVKINYKYTKVKIELDDDQKAYNDFAQSYKVNNYTEAFNEFAALHYGMLTNIFDKIKDEYRENIMIPLITKAVAESDDEYSLVLKKGTKLYKGVTKPLVERLSFKSTDDILFYWFAFDPMTTFNYTLSQKALPRINGVCHGDTGIGYVGEFDVNYDIKLLNLLYPNIITYLTQFTKNDKTIMDTINKILKIDEQGNVIRTSVYEDDIKFVKWLCVNNFDGYISTSAASLHPELCLCKPVDKVRIESVNAISELFHFCDDTYKDVDFITSFVQALY